MIQLVSGSGGGGGGGGGGGAAPAPPPLVDQEGVGSGEAAAAGETLVGRVHPLAAQLLMHLISKGKILNTEQRTYLHCWLGIEHLAAAEAVVTNRNWSSTDQLGR